MLDGNEVHAKTATDGEDALGILGVSDLSLRFPAGHDFLEANTRMLGLGEVEGGRTVRFSLPTQLRSSGGRKAPRTGDTEGAHATFELRSKRKIRASISDLSISGLRMNIDEDLPFSELKVKDQVDLSLSLPGEMAMTNGAVIRHIGYRTFGLEFDPPLSYADLVTLSKWVFMRLEQEREQAASREDASVKAALRAEGEQQNTVGDGVLLVTGDDALKLSLRDLLGSDMVFLSVPPSQAPLEYALSQKPLLVILHASGAGGDQKRLLAALAAGIPKDTPTLMLGSDMDAGALSDLARECRAVTSMLMAPNKGPFLQRLVLGILRKYYAHGESPMAV
jgi:hypothetical protein